MKRHNVTKTVYNAIQKTDCFNGQTESVSINTKIIGVIRFKCNRPDTVLWGREQRICTVVEISCSVEENEASKTVEKEHLRRPNKLVALRDSQLYTLLTAHWAT